MTRKNKLILTYNEIFISFDGKIYTIMVKRSSLMDLCVYYTYQK